ncbi:MULTISPECIES: TetR/AcrR family transcriptional regulator [Psychrilyobacter]|uniref:TetR family transcriptional regulator n=1 Tax=Psychrilyobacter piezotolerans TaxID=2293438 RepID=A0ABX9KFN7_9FUSO|nr:MULTISPECIES: TetR/AcrR family transcriptional regulator [Psychrilyobacter]MCS5421567.1 TetR/AcrR family transcriptional regulator [Psychrilyobacter sp. S5]NDI78587.1 TetR/AcrR family transcriptional regulator [Psychrilyobacter piezotolerans]RDE60290.1 TetR/AcrR family transcriptional regulator [Psychrilyobacter sp. S5]REI40398.1 TetR family transcriptional regulator [Psychrilyobacter piezotolerans]
MNNTKSEIIRVALRMVSERGYEWLSFKKVADEVGIAKSSIYHYFKKKEDLGIAVMEVIEERIQKNKDEILTYESEKEKLDAYLIRADKEDTLYAEAMAQLAFNFNGLPPKLQEKFRKRSIKDYEFVLGILKRGAEKKEFSIKKDLEEAAMGIILMSIGGYLYGRVFHDENVDISKYITDSIINKN